MTDYNFSLQITTYLLPICISSILTQTHTHTRLTVWDYPGDQYQKGKTNLDFTEARDSEWQWHQLGICKSAPRSRQITTPAPHHSVFYRPDAFPVAQPTASKHWRHKTIYIAPKSKIKSKAHYALESAWGFHVQIRHSAIHGEQCHHA